MGKGLLKNELENNDYFKHEFNNKIGLCLYEYLVLGQYGDLTNPDPADLNKNTVPKVFNYLKVIEDATNKPINELTITDMREFINKLVHGELKIKKAMPKKQVGGGYKIVIQETNKTRDPKTATRYVAEFKRLWTIYREYALINEPDTDLKQFEWGLKFKAPKQKQSYDENYPLLTVEQVQTLAKEMPGIEARVRVLLSFNLIARPSEIEALTLKDIEKRDGRTYIQLPNIKKHSTQKVPVELYDFIKKELDNYLKIFQIEDKQQPLFPTKYSTFAKQLKKVTKYLFNEEVSPKYIRKMAIHFNKELGKTTREIERVGGWKFNSDAINHYEKRVGVSNENSKEIEERVINGDLRIFVERLQTQITSLEEKREKEIEMFEGLIGELATKFRRERLGEDAYPVKVEFKSILNSL